LTELRKHTSVGYVEKDRKYRFTGERFISEYLDPDDKRGCGPHMDPECLCDVDISKTEGMVFDSAPMDFLGVVDTEDLIKAAANIWLNYDLAQGIKFLPAWFDEPDGGETLEKVIELVKQRKGEKAICAELGLPRMDNHTLSAMRRAIGVPARSHLADPVPKERILCLHHEGKSVIQISRQITKERGFLLAHRSIYRVLRENDLTPNVTGVYGRPIGFQMGKGITYAEWREGVRPPDYEG
jgi:hypothetical protein